MRFFRFLTPLCLLAQLGLADLTPQQKTSDFLQLVALYDVNYAPYNLKIQLYNFDLLNIQPWLAQVAQTTNDIQFYDVCVRYVASLQDSHDEFTILSDYDAWLHFDGDLYDGNFLIDYIDRSYLSSRTYNFAVGDQLISVDGVTVADLLTQFAPYSVNGSANPVSRARLAAATITERYQGWYPLASVGTSATIVVQHQDGTMGTYTIPWDVQGTQVTTAGIFPSPMSKAITDARKEHTARRLGLKTNVHRRGTNPYQGVEQVNPWLRAGVDPTFTSIATDNTPDPEPPAYMAPLTALANMKHVSAEFAISGSSLEPFDSLYPVFNPPAGFKLRLGFGSADQFLSGTFPAGTGTIGFIRIPTFAPSSTSAAVAQFANEMQYFQANTDGLVIDVMGNGGGSGCYAQTLASYVIPFTFQGLTQQVVANLTWQVSFDGARINAINSGAPAWVAQLYSVYLTAIQQALTSNRAMTGALPLCSSTPTTPSATSSSGKNLAYKKPVLVLTDNFTLSSAEIFTMFLQDNQRGTIFGTRTDGGGGNVVGYSQATAYSQGSTRVTEGLIMRLNPVAANGFPSLPYYDSVGIQPDILQDYMTANNLATGGADFVAAAISAIRNLTGK
ncbi:MAG TPA: S41 family peptidase [Bryobacteraceae bacterium]|nr:S41 family peptidase [Bryobacteraceae bacterium]